MYGLAYSSLVNVVRTEGFASSGGDSATVVLALLGLVLFVVLQLFVVQWLWNTVLVRVLTVARPLPSLMYTLGLLVLIAMVHPGVAV